MTGEAIMRLACQHGFMKAYFLDASLASDAPEGIKTLLLLLYPYHSWGEAAPGCLRISTYYFAAQKAYLQAKELVRQLNAAEELARLSDDVRLKPLLSLLRDFSQGRNTIHYHKEFGSRFHVQLIGLCAHHTMNENIRWRHEVKPVMCASCQKCLHACPTQALTAEGFVRGKCLRQHMLRAAPVPPGMRDLMENRLLGCDICQQVCPYNAFLTDETVAGEHFPLDSLLVKDGETLARLANAIGRNMAVPNRVCAQACLVAGNSGQPSYLPALQKLCSHASQTVAEHAEHAVKKLTTEAQEMTT